MDGWQEIQNEIAATASPENPAGDFDGVRRAKYKAFTELTGRQLLVYATAFHVPAKAQMFGQLMAIDLSDKDGFNEITSDAKVEGVDVFLHSPGGSAEATESIVKLIRKRFKKVRFIVTGSAKSAATMLALSGDTVLMDEVGEVGPIDPQVFVAGRYSPAGSIIEQFEKAEEILGETPAKLPAWIPILEKFAPALLVECANYIELARKLVSSWLLQYMFVGESKKKAGIKAARIARYLANEKKSLSHARRIDAQELSDLGVKVERVEDLSPALQKTLRHVHLAVMATLENTGVIKMFENSEGRALFRAAQPMGPARPN